MENINKAVKQLLILKISSRCNSLNIVCSKYVCSKYDLNVIRRTIFFWIFIILLIRVLYVLPQYGYATSDMDRLMHNKLV